MAGPWVSIRMPINRWRALAAARMSPTTRRTQSCCECDMLSRKTLTPASMSRPSISGESVAGPRGAVILVLRGARESGGAEGGDDFGFARGAGVHGRSIAGRGWGERFLFVFRAFD